MLRPYDSEVTPLEYRRGVGLFTLNDISEAISMASPEERLRFASAILGLPAQTTPWGVEALRDQLVRNDS